MESELIVPLSFLKSGYMQWGEYTITRGKAPTVCPGRNCNLFTSLNDMPKFLRDPVNNLRSHKEL